jgi:hypothetical protein
MNTKTDFIADLLTNKKLNASQKEKVFSLVAKEFKQDELEIKKIWEEINKIKDKNSIEEFSSTGSINTSNFVNEENLLDVKLNISEKETDSINHIPNEDTTNPKIKKHSPKTMVKVLYLFSINEDFKWFTHKPDNSIDKIDYTIKLNEFEINLKALRLTWYINHATYFFILNFFKDNLKGFSISYPIEYKTNLNYANHKIRKEIESGISPFDIVIDGEYFSKIIDLFKNSIEFRLDNKEYKFHYVFRNFITNNLSIDFIEEYGYNFDAIAKSLTTYIDVNNFYKGLKIILKWIDDYKSISYQIFIDLQNHDEYYNLIIFHKGSYFQTEPISSKLNGNSGDLNKLRKYWFSIVDWSIEADCVYDKKTETYNFICLNENTELIDNKLTKNIIEKLDNNVEGVKHIIKIYKTKNL